MMSAVIVVVAHQTGEGEEEAVADISRYQAASAAAREQRQKKKKKNASLGHRVLERREVDEWSERTDPGCRRGDDGAGMIRRLVVRAAADKTTGLRRSAGSSAMSAASALPSFSFGSIALMLAACVLRDTLQVQVDVC